MQFVMLEAALTQRQPTIALLSVILHSLGVASMGGVPTVALSLVIMRQTAVAVQTEAFLKIRFYFTILPPAEQTFPRQEQFRFLIAASLFIQMAQVE